MPLFCRGVCTASEVIGVSSHVVDLACDPLGFVADEPAHQFGDVIGLSPAYGRNHRCHRCTGRVRSPSGVHRARLDAVDGDAAIRQQPPRDGESDASPARDAGHQGDSSRKRSALGMEEENLGHHSLEDRFHRGRLDSTRCQVVAPSFCERVHAHARESGRKIFRYGV